MENKDIVRIQGNDRIETSKRASDYVNSDTLILASGYSFADSLSSKNVANKTGVKVVLVGNNTNIYDMFKGKGIKKYIVGGMVNKNVINSARKLTSNIKILDGVDRYATNKLTLDEFGFKSAGVADGRNFPDNLSANPLLKKKA